MRRAPVFGAFLLALLFLLPAAPAFAQTCNPANDLDDGSNPACPGDAVCSYGTNSAGNHVCQSGTATDDGDGGASGTVTATGGGMKFSEFANRIIIVVDEILVPILYGLAFLFFLIGIARLFFSPSEESREKGKQFAIWGVIGLVVIFGVWGIVRLLLTVLN